MQGKWFRRGSVGLLCCALLAGLVAMAQTHRAALKRAHKPERMFAPYVDMAVQPNNLPQIRKDSGIRYFTLAFVNADRGCVPSWPDSQHVADDSTISGYVSALRASGGDAIIAFGGYDGTELAKACGDVASLQAAYQQVVDKYKLTVLDFDIEHLALNDQSSIDRRNAAIKNLANANPGLQINFTLPGTPAGVTDEAMNVLKAAVAQGTPVKLINVMVMDYGLSAESKNMGANAIAAMDAAQGQLKSLGLNAKLGITPMIGMNDAKGETFTLADASTVLSYAQQHASVALLAFWSVARDNGSCSAKVAPNCSGIRQKPWQFTQLFSAFH